MNETKKPAVRFKGFSVEWERHPMDELTTELHEYATLDSLYPLLTSSREGIMFQNEYRSNLLLLTAFVGQSPALFDVWTSLFAGGAGEGCRSAEFNWQ